jgi:Zn-dependent metalloprotease
MMALGAAAQTQDWKKTALRYTWDEIGGYPSFVRFQDGQGPALLQLYPFLRSALKLDAKDALQLRRTETDAIGWTHYTFDQTREGVPVFGGVYKVHMKDGKAATMNGRIFRIATAAPAPMPEPNALGIAVTALPASEYLWESPSQVEAFRYAINDPYATAYPVGSLTWVRAKSGAFAGQMRLSWKFDVYASKPVAREDIYVDVVNGEVIYRNGKIHTIDVTGTALTYYSGMQTITTDSFASGFRLREVGRGGGVETYNCQFGTSYGGAVDFLDSDNFWNNANPNIEEAGPDGHWAAELTYDYYMGRHGRNSFDDNGSKMLSYIHFDQNYSNAFWDGQRMTYGSGGNNQRPFCSLDISGHEFSHGVTGNSAGLVYQDEPGALNESFSDIFGTTIEFYGKGSAAANWLIGEDVGAFRNMADPNQFQNPDTYFGSFWVTGTFDNGGVHFNSGVQNHWYYLLSQGGSGTNDNGDAFSVSGISIDSAAKIAYRNLNFYLTPMDEYVDARRLSIEAASDLFGECSPQMISTVKAWYAVGVGNDFTGVVTADFYTPDSASCSVPKDVYFQNNSFSALQYIWNFGDGGTSTQENPMHTYTAQGTYTVTLIAIGCNGVADTLVLPNRVIVDESLPCVTNMPTGNDNIVLSACSGEIYDSGGNQDYLPNTFSTVTIQATGGSHIQLSFVSFAFAAGDNVRIYDGPNTSSPILGTFTGLTLPPTLTSTGIAMTIRESTNASNAKDGFHATWSCVVGNTPAQGINFQLFPNPAQDAATIRLEGVQGSVSFRLTDALGRVHLTGEGESNGSFERRLPLQGLSAGIYFVELRAGDARAVQRLDVR